MPYLFLVLGCIGLGLSYIGLSIPVVQQFDHSVVAWMTLQHFSFLNKIAVSLSLIGGLPSVLLICTIACIGLVRSKAYADILFICIGISGSAAVGWILKYLINRPRPIITNPLVETYGASFPSAHSLYAATLSALIMFILSKHAHARVHLFLACLWWICMGVSRVYLGAHYPTDVIAGWSIGFIWIAVLWLVLSQLVVFKKKLYSLESNEVE